MHASALRLADQAEAIPTLALLSPAYEVLWLGELHMRRKLLKDERQARMAAGAVAAQRALLRRLFEAKVELVPGSGAPRPWLFPGRSLVQELGEWERAGIPAADVLALATRGAAEALGEGERRGRVAPGLVADLVVVGADPTQSLQALDDPEWVVVRGRLLERETREDLLATLAAEQAEVREALARPIEVPEPEVPEGAIVLRGRVETRALGQPISAERYAVVREPDGRVAYCGRIVFARTGEETRRELTIVQHARDGELEEFRVALRQGGRELACEGLWTAQTLRIRRALDGKSARTQSAAKRPVCLDVGSVTSYMLLGQREIPATFPVLVLHEGLEPELVNWSHAVDDEGVHRVRSNTSLSGFVFTEKGGVERLQTVAGQAMLETLPEREDALGGSGLPRPASARRAEPEPDHAPESPPPGGGGEEEAGSGG
jgi:hypothetical protein